MKNVSGEIKALSTESAQTQTNIQINPADISIPLTKTSSTTPEKQKKPSKTSAVTLGHLHGYTPAD